MHNLVFFCFFSGGRCFRKQTSQNESQRNVAYSKNKNTQ